MKKASIALLLFLSILDVNAQNPTLLWAQRFGGADEDAGLAMSVDGAGNVYTTGYFYGTSDFDPGASTYNLTSLGWSDIYVSKLDAAGNFLWVKNIGSTSYESGLSLKSDAAGNIYVTGYFRGTVDFDPGPAIYNLTSNGGSDFFIWKLDASGNFLWAKSIGGTSDEYAYTIGVDASSRIYVAGYFQNTVDFDPGPGNSSLTASGTYDIFLARYDINGNHTWSEKLGSGNAFHSSIFYNQVAIAFDSGGNIYLTGAFLGTGDFDPGPGTVSLSSSGGTDIFIAKFAQTGTLTWAKKMGGPENDYAFCIAIDAASNICLSGTFTGVADFDPGPVVNNLSAVGSNDFFAVKLDGSGNLQWAKSIGGTSADFGMAIALDGSSNIYITGYFGSNVDFNPGPATNSLTSFGGPDVFVLKLDPAGNHLMSLKVGGPTPDMGTGLFVDAGEHIYVEGIFSSTADFDPGPGTYNLTSAGDNDVFVMKLDQYCPPSVTITSLPTMPVCAGSAITFTAAPVNGGSAPAYQWQVNGVNAGTNSATFTSTSLVNGDVVTVILTSNAVCASPTTATSNAITVSINPQLTPAVSISANPAGPVCAGIPITFTATPVNGGASPIYQWKVNGINAGTNSPTFTSSTLANGDFVTVDMTSGATCASPSQVISNVIIAAINPLLTPTVNITSLPTGAICAGILVSFTAVPANGGPTPAYQWKVNGINVGTNGANFNSSTLSNGDVVSVELTSSETCVTAATASSALTMVVNPLLTPSVSIIASPSTPVCAGTTINFTATPVNGGTTPSYQWKVNGINAGTNSSTFSSSTLNNGDIVTVVLTSTETCVSATTATSNAITVAVNPILVPSVSITSSPAGAVCAGTIVNFTALPVNGGTTPSYQWKVNGVNAGTNNSTFSTAALSNGDIVTVQITSNQACVSPLTATSNAITLTVNPLLTPSVNITANPVGAICPGTPVSFSATTTNGGTTPVYQWKLNGANVGTNLPNFNSASLANGDIVSVEITSNETCASPLTALSNLINIIVTPQVTPSVTVTALPAGSVCPGSAINFTASPVSGGNSPSYQWKVNGVNVGANSPTYTSTTLVNGDLVTVVMTSSSSCAVPNIATSVPVVAAILPPLTPSVSITASPSGAVCPGASVTFTAGHVNGGSSPSYQWKVNGINTGTNNSTFTSNTLNNGDIITVELTSNAICASPLVATSNQIIQAITPPVIPSVNITANPVGPICPGTPVTFTAIPVNGGATPSYQWKVNGTNSGTNSPSFTTSTLNDGDIVTVEMISNAACATPANAVSNAITLVVNPNVAPAVTITSSSTGAVCSGTMLTFTATPVNGGTTPSYQWKVNGSNTGSNSPVFSSSSLNNGDVVTVQLTSSITCAVPASATSNSITVQVNPLLTPVVTINANPATPVCPGTLITFNALSSNGGSSPAYQWKVNGVATGSNSFNFSSSSLSNGDVVSVEMTSNANCATPVQVTSNNIVVAVNATVTPAVTIYSNASSAVCPGTPVTFTATPANGGTTPSYQWKVNGVNAGINSPTFTSASFNNGDVVSVQMTSNAVCPVPATVQSNSITINVMPQVSPSIVINASPSGPVCPGTMVTYTAVSSNGGSSPVVQWKVNGNSVGTNNATFITNSLGNGDLISADLITSIPCAIPSNVSSNIITQLINPNVVPAVSIVSDRPGAICPGTSVKFTATPVYGGLNPVYQWKVNGVNAGTNSSIFTSSSLVNGDVVTVDIVSTALCADPANASSNGITVNVNPIIVPAVSITSSTTGPICADSKIMFNASPVNGGSSPTYKWLLNGITVGTNSSSFSLNKVSDGDAVKVVLYSNAQCANPQSITSNTIDLKIDYASCPSYFFMPTGFTPNGDGRNDILKPTIDGKIVSYKFTVFNRWGQKIFESLDVKKGWDGNLFGVESDTNVFVWMVSYQFLGQAPEMKKGTVVLIR